MSSEDIDQPEVVQSEEIPPAAIDLMAALKASLERAKAARGETARTSPARQSLIKAEGA